MATTTTWQIETLKYELKDGYVYKVVYCLVGRDGEHEYRYRGEVALPKPDTLVPYKDLTEDTVLGWVKDKLEEDWIKNKLKDEKAGIVKQIEDSVKANLATLKTPTYATGKPWS